MRGQKSILDNRLANIPVTSVWVFVVDFDELEKHRIFLDPEKMLELELRAEVLIYLNDVIARLDFRFLVATTVHLSGIDAARTLAVQRRIKLFSPSLLITATHDYFNIYEYLEAA